MVFRFATAGQIIFGPGVVRQLAGLAESFGRHALVVSGSNASRAEPLKKNLLTAHIKCSHFQVTAEPDVDIVASGAQLARHKGCDMVVGIGGGSVIDTAKAIAALINNLSPLHDYLEVIGKALPLQNPPAPCIAIPTTAGTGSEVTSNAVIRSNTHRVKVSLRSPGMLPDAAVVDPALTLSLPPEVTAATGFDALCQLLEAYVSNKANPLTDSLCHEGLIRCGRSLHRAWADGDNLDARTDMALASLFSGLALANAGLGAVHGIAGPLGGMHHAPHGDVCARLLPVVTAANIKTLQTDNPQGVVMMRFTEIARLLTGDAHATAHDGVQWLQTMADALQIPALRQWKLRPEEVPALAKQSLNASSMQGNPVTLSTETIEAIIHQAMGPEH